MNTTNKRTEKRIYSIPLVECVKLDNEISLQLESDAPIGPGESLNRTPEYLNSNPFKATFG